MQRYFTEKLYNFFSLSKLLEIGLELDEKFDPFFDPFFKIEKYVWLQSHFYKTENVWLQSYFFRGFKNMGLWSQSNELSN